MAPTHRDFPTRSPAEAPSAAVAMEVTRPVPRLPGPTPPAEPHPPRRTPDPRRTPRTRKPPPRNRGCRRACQTARHSRQPGCPARARTGCRRSSSRRGPAALLRAKPTARQLASGFRSNGADDHRWLETCRRHGKSIATTDISAGLSLPFQTVALNILKPPFRLNRNGGFNLFLFFLARTSTHLASSAGTLSL